MKDMIIAIILITSLLICIVFNFIYLNSIADNMNDMIKQISAVPSSENQDLIDSLKSFWEKHYSWVSLSVSFSDMDELTNAIDAVSASNAMNDSALLSTNIQRLENAVEAMVRLEKFKISNILKKQLVNKRVVFSFGIFR